MQFQTIKGPRTKIHLIVARTRIVYKLVTTLCGQMLKTDNLTHPMHFDGKDKNCCKKCAKLMRGNK